MYSSYKACTPSDTNATAGLIIDGNCKVTKCVNNLVPNYYATECTCPSDKTAYNSNNQECVYDVVSCENSELPSNATDGQKTWVSANNAYGSCVATACDTGYKVSSGECVPE